MYRKIMIFLSLYFISAFILYFVIEKTSFLLPAIFLGALASLIFLIGYLAYYYYTKKQQNN
ncbi:hypothetical protein AB4X15_05185 [Peribacillus simplex]|uniref:hypothetical protein n=1 Tax=Peribacillus TaxID=2675229 RepID=UPI00177C5201|nr:hypothetical protein [Brevibacillus sp. JNUCC-41]QOS88219.1 hypothetical protein JNUCC41_15315 [Brevibacillus sp. JNUCC-41]